MWYITRMNFDLIETVDALEKVCAHFSQQAVICVDTEFYREVTYYPELALVQIACSERTVCIDPLKIDDLQALFDLLLNPQVLKVFHASSQDMEVFHTNFNILPTPIFDTQLAAKKIGYGDQIGYANLIKECLDIELDKSQTRTDWLQRPLQPKQLEYAANDVIYLMQSYPLLCQKLQEKNSLQELRDSCVELSHPKRFEIAYNSMWRKVKGHRYLAGQDLAILQAIAAWREHEAQALNRPRRHTLSDAALIEIVKQQPEDREALLSLPSLQRYGVSQSSSDALLQSLREGISQTKEHWPKWKR